MRFRQWAQAVLISTSLLVTAAALGQERPPATITVDARAVSHPFPHFWEQMFGSGRAILTLRDSYRRDLRDVRAITGFQYVRFHAILHDEVGLYDEDASGNPVYNFSYIDQIYDGLLKEGVRPMVEISFMPRKLSADPPTVHAFWYKQLVSPPKDWSKWEALVSAFTKHLVERYGIEEVSQWYFEIWNEPNIDFWAGDPKEQTYYELYDHAARAIKTVSPRLRVGGPATAQAAWVDRFIRHCTEQHVPFDFVSTHVYANDTAQDVFGTEESIPRDRMVCRAVAKVHDQINRSAAPNTPLLWTEYNASYKNELEVTDSTFMGPWLADTIRQCDGLVDVMSYWTFSDVFEEQGVVKTPFYGGFGLISAGGVPKPAFNAFKLLHRLGDERIATDSDSVLVTKRKDGSLAVAVWNYAAPEEKGTARTITLKITGWAGKRVTVQQVDDAHGSFWPAYKKMGEPRFPTPEQYRTLQQAAELPAPYSVPWNGGVIRLELPPHALVLLEIQ